MSFLYIFSINPIVELSYTLLAEIAFPVSEHMVGAALFYINQLFAGLGPLALTAMMSHETQEESISCVALMIFI